MTYPNADLKKRTNVRLIVAIFTALLVTSCGSVARLSSQTEPCLTPGPAVCEAFGPESRCRCADASGVSRELARFNASAQLGLRSW